ncbi:FliM/FliN family flagellar motor switch protein [Herbaspirillum sp. RTI4]|uniref:FliM/FliN family flagellar motor switch protein n=1 Tax=Herbaspirillum sp. RTI4 TaxID=3048640 RepID=UPI002AB50B31|nr:FliM/FliN family flagellar motor switch protein [Herbaspirillum sp. RTI4]MDY7578370.1 FliM/FliN family flagellar motor switch protein [Herbaspirillum sp. RTI4]MEA9983514.1 FliM/FliN family flagellar motor switch protein [Herbaspirillum sp. RTI4]
MMNQFPLLRCVTQRDAGIERALPFFQSMNIDAWITSVLPWGRYFRFRLTYENSIASCLVDVDQWANVQFPELGGIAWSAMPECELRPLVTALEKPLIFAHQYFDYRSAVLMDIVDVTANNLATESALVCYSHEATVYFEELPKINQDFQASTVLPYCLTVPVEFLIGKSVISTQLFKRIAIGDALLIEEKIQVARTSNQHLFTFSLTGNDITIKEIIMRQYNAPSAVLEGESDLNTIHLDQLKLVVEIVLARKEYTAAELVTLQKGELITLPADSHQKVDLVVNNKIIASGELVQIDNILAVQVQSLQRN